MDLTKAKVAKNSHYPKNPDIRLKMPEKKADNSLQFIDLNRYKNPYIFLKCKYLFGRDFDAANLRIFIDTGQNNA